MPPALTPAVLAELRRPRPYPAVSVLMPTHRREPDNAQDPIRLRNLVAEAAKRLKADPAVTGERRQEVAAQLDRALAETDLVHAEDGLAIFAAPGEHHVWTLPRDVPARVVLSDSFLTRNLVAAHEAQRPFWVLAVAADRVSLWKGDAHGVVEVRMGGFPRTRPLLENPDAEREEQIGDVPSTFRDEGTRHFLREADTALKGVVGSPSRLYVAGEAAALAALADVGSVGAKAHHVPHGGLAHATPEAVWQALRPVVQEQREQEIADTLREVENSHGRREFAAGVDEVWQNVAAGRVGLLVVEEDYRVTVREEGNHLVPAEPGDTDSREDMVDEIVEQALEKGADVRFVPDGRLGDSSGIAAVLRY
ncbi:baeRF3 domain-containing protein [Streptomyces sp. NPDC002004]